MRSATKQPSVFLASIILLFVSNQSHSQSMSIFGGSSLAHDCFDAATAAVLIQRAGFDDIETCDNALIYGKLPRADMIATYVNRGIIYTALEKYDRAQRDYARAMSMDDSEPAAYLNRGNLWFMAQEFDRAIADYSKSMELDLSQRHVAYLNRGMAHENLGHFEQAQSDYDASLELRPNWEMALEKLDRVKKKLAN